MSGPGRVPARHHTTMGRAIPASGGGSCVLEVEPLSRVRAFSSSESWQAACGVFISLWGEERAGVEVRALGNISAGDRRHGAPQKSQVWKFCL